VQYFFPPKKINNWYGYRTPLSKSRQEIWDEGNKFSALYLIKLGVIFIVIGLCTTTAINVIAMPVKVKEALSVLLLMVSGMLPAILMLTATEKHLTKLFGKK
jgi:uncharacterized membrane protein